MSKRAYVSNARLHTPSHASVDAIAPSRSRSLVLRSSRLRLEHRLRRLDGAWRRHGGGGRGWVTSPLGLVLGRLASSCAVARVCASRRRVCPSLARGSIFIGSRASIAPLPSLGSARLTVAVGRFKSPARRSLARPDRERRDDTPHASTRASSHGTSATLVRCACRRVRH